MTEDIDCIKNKLRAYTVNEIEFNEPHFTQQLMLREGNREAVIKNLLSPDKLVHAYPEEGKYGDTKYTLYFEISNTRTMVIPVIFDKNKKKSLYIITYILRYRPWQSMIKRK